MRVDEIFGPAMKKMATKVVKAVTKFTDGDDFEPVKKGNMVSPRSREMAAMADMVAAAKKTARKPVMPMGKSSY